MAQDLHNKYRPKGFDEVVGHDAIVKSLKSALKEKTSHAFLFAGPSGTGKTTLARIIAKYVKCDKRSIIEVDGASTTGIDAMRDITDTVRYAGIGKTPTRVVIVDEAHGLSKQAWSALLKSVEEPGEHLYWVFCTTDAHRVPQTIKTRCLTFTLKPVKADVLTSLLESVCEREKIDVEDDIIDLVVEECNGSPRQAITYLAAVSSCDDVDEAADALQSIAASPEVIDLCRLLVSNKASWVKALKILKGIDTTSGEGIRMVIVSYFEKVALGTKGKDDASRALAVLEAFADPYPPQAKLYPVLLSLGDLLLGE